MSLTPKKKSAFARPGRRSSAPPWRSRLRSASPVVGHFGYDYLTTGRYLESTDDAYVKADSTIISPKVSGYIARVLVGDNQPVKAGQVLAEIDNRDFKAALAQADADVAASEAAVRNLDAQLALQQPIIEQGTADVDAAEANLKFAQEEQARYDGLMKTGSGTVQRAQQTDAALRAGTAQLQHAKSGLSAAQRKVDVLTTERAKAVAQVDRARAVESQAALNLSYTQIKAPVDGTVGARSIRVGQYVQAGTQLMAVVPLDAVYVVANFKETQLTHVRNGQPVEVEIDSFHGTRLRGHVDSLSPASGSRIRAAAAGQCHRQFHQDRAARAGEDRAGRPAPERPAAPRHVGGADRRYQGDRCGRARDPSPVGFGHRPHPPEAAGACRAKIINPHWTILSRLPGLSKQPA